MLHCLYQFIQLLHQYRELRGLDSFQNLLLFYHFFLFSFPELTFLCGTFFLHDIGASKLVTPLSYFSFLFAQLLFLHKALFLRDMRTSNLLSSYSTLFLLRSFSFFTKLSFYMIWGLKNITFLSYFSLMNFLFSTWSFLSTGY